MGTPWENLQAMKLEEMYDEYNRLMENTHLGAGYWRDEIQYRHQEMQTNKIVYLTWAIVMMTAVVTVCTVIIATNG